MSQHCILETRPQPGFFFSFWKEVSLAVVWSACGHPSPASDSWQTFVGSVLGHAAVLLFATVVEEIKEY